MAKTNPHTSGQRHRNFERQAQADMMFASIGDGAISTDAFGRITRVNPVALDLLGFQEKEVIGEWFPGKVVAVTADDIPMNLIDRPITKAFLTGRTIYEKMYYRRKDGQLIPVSTTVSPILLDGQPIGAIEVFRDITLDEEIDRMKSEFISLASHQLRTPLSAIKTYSHMLVDGFMGDVTDTQRKSLHTIIAAANRMNELISTLLNITRIESGTISVTLKRVDIGMLIDEVIAEVSLLAADRSIEVSFNRTPKANLRTKTDPLIFKEVLTNLVVNAVKYTPEKGSVIITARRRAKDTLISVKDNGWGIPEHAQDQVFSKFFRAQNIVRRETTGTGLGLYLVKGLVAALEGTIWFKSVEGKGTEFSFTVPHPKRGRPTKTLSGATDEEM
ncbi:MAG TPA: PAS domain-containing sensor histidine kinase [Candidatus Saccharimonadales bacterium]|nr:PAS domain-containing sensor histidine kinase [Candidatus Saccharimonadales bacterium]